MINPRYYQKDAVNAIYNYFANGNKGNPLVCMPTGTGKSVVIGGFIFTAFQRFPELRLMMLTHDERLISQNAQKLKEMWKTAPVGICCAGLKQKQTNFPITYGSLKTVANIIQTSAEKNMPHFGNVDLLLIDECHLVSPNEETKYRFIINQLKEINPLIKIIGFTATPYRMKLGLLTNNGIFTDVCYDCTDSDSFFRFIQDGFLCNIITKKTQVEIDSSNVKHSASGEFNEKSANQATNNEALLISAINEMKIRAVNRKSWLIFTPSIEVCENVAELMNSSGLNVTYVHSKLKAKEIDERIKAFKNGEYLGIVNKDMLTTGFDHPPIDFIGNLRLSESPGLWVQMVGRGARPFPGKPDCLVLDFAANTKRLGPINAPVMPKPPGKGGGDAPVWSCPECDSYNAAAARFCVSCGCEHTFQTKYSGIAADDDILKRLDEKPVSKIEYFKVTHVTYSLHEKQNKAPTLKVVYYCGMLMFNEFIAFESNSKYIKDKCAAWWYQRSPKDLPFTTIDALNQVRTFRVPNKIKVNLAGDYPEVLAAEW